LEGAVRAGLVGYGLLHLLVAWVAVRLVLDAGSGLATGRGALAQLASGGVGRFTLGAMAAGFAALALWQLAAAVVGYRDRDGWSRQLMRAGAACRVVSYAYLAVASAGLALGGRSARGQSPQPTTAKVMALPAGPWLMARVGAVAAGTGVGLAVFGSRRQFVPQVDARARTAGRRVPIVMLGCLGYVAKGFALVMIGALLCWVAATHDPQRSGGLDDALHELLGHTVGSAAVVMIGAGIGCFGLFLLARARHLSRRTLTA
jgi:hypothetical protein